MITVDPDVFYEEMSRNLSAHPALYSVQYALTYRCNLACVHCYAEGAGCGAPEELAAEEVADLFGQFAEAGCLHCTVTGGEALTRPDFEQVWLAIAERGIRRLLYTNATLVDDRRAAFLREVPPDWIEVSLYGADAATHDAVTRVPGSLEATMAGVRLLQGAGLRVRIKAIVMRSNAHQIGEIKALAQRLGDGSFRLDGQLMGSFVGAIDMDVLRVEPEALAQIEWEHDPQTEEAWCREELRMRGFDRQSLYTCGAALRSAYLSPWGDLHPCLSAVHLGYPLRKHSVREAWDAMRTDLRSKSFPDDHPCRDCADALFCQNCPPAARLDSGDERGVAPYRCALAKARRKVYTRRGRGICGTDGCQSALPPPRQEA